MSESSADALADLAPVSPPILVVVPDPESRFDSTKLVLGRSLVDRLAEEARRAGFVQVVRAPGTHVDIAGADEVATGEPLDAPALVVFEDTYVHPHLLSLMVEHPLDADERFSLYDGAGRPAGWFTGRLQRVPALCPISEEIDWPEPLGPSDVARCVMPEDDVRAEALVLRAMEIPGPWDRPWQKHVSLPLLRFLARTRHPLAQVELLVLSGCLAAGPLALIGHPLAFVIAALSLLIGVHASRLMRPARWLRNGTRDDNEPHLPGERLSRACVPLGHASYMIGLTYVLVAEQTRSGVAGVVLLAAGAAAALLSLLQARRMLHGLPSLTLALPRAHELAQRLGIPLPKVLDGAPLFELGLVLAALSGVPELPWWILTVAAIARVWRWFAGPAQAVVVDDRQ